MASAESEDGANESTFEKRNAEISTMELVQSHVSSSLTDKINGLKDLKIAINHNNRLRRLNTKHIEHRTRRVSSCFSKFDRIRSKHEIMLNNEARPNPQLQLSLLTSESLINRINSDEMLIGRRENLDNEGLISISTGQPRLQCDDRIAKNIDNFVHSVQNLAQSRGQMLCERRKKRTKEEWIKLGLAKKLFLEGMRQKEMQDAVVKNKTESLKGYLSLGSSPISDIKKRTLLHLAAPRGYKELVEILLEHGLNPNDKDKEGNTPLHLAFNASKMQVVFVLLQAMIRPLVPANSPIYERLEVLKNKPEVEIETLKDETIAILQRLTDLTEQLVQQMDQMDALTNSCAQLTLTNCSNKRDEIMEVLGNIRSLSLTG